MHIGIDKFSANVYYVDKAKKCKNRGIHKNQLKQDRESEQLSLFDPRDPFKVSK